MIFRKFALKKIKNMSENNIKSIAVLTSGGDAPGMNAALRAVVRTANHFNIDCYGIREGYNGLIAGDVTKWDLVP